VVSTEPARPTIAPSPAAPMAAPPQSGEPETSSPATPARKRGKPRPTPAEPVIPLVHAPDDPGPDAVGDEAEPQPESPAGSWRKLFE